MPKSPCAVVPQYSLIVPRTHESTQDFGGQMDGCVWKLALKSYKLAHWALNKRRVPGQIFHIKIQSTKLNKFQSGQVARPTVYDLLCILVQTIGDFIMGVLIFLR